MTGESFVGELTFKSKENAKRVLQALESVGADVHFDHYVNSAGEVRFKLRVQPNREIFTHEDRRILKEVTRGPLRTRSDS